MRSAVALAVLIATVALTGCWAPPQIGPDRDTFKAVDALYTAISLREPKLVESCVSKLNDLKAAGKVPEAAFGPWIRSSSRPRRADGNPHRSVWPASWKGRDGEGILSTLLPRFRRFRLRLIRSGHSAPSGVRHLAASTTRHRFLLSREFA